MNEPARQIVVVSGGSRGLGGGVVADLLARGNVVATFSRSATPFVEDCQAKYPDSFVWGKIDATDHEAVRRFVFEFARRYGTLDALVNNAGVDKDGLLALARAADISQMLTINLESTIRLTQTCLKWMIQARRGSIVNVSSVNAVQGNKGVAVYSATKAGLDGLTRSLARELGERGIRVNSIAPGYFDSAMTAGLNEELKARILRRTPLGRLASVDDLVGVVRFLLSPDSSFITGQTIVVDGGLTC